MAEFRSHSDKQERAIFSEKPLLLLGAGTQWGKTQVGAIRMKTKIFTYTDPEDNFIITSPTYKTMMQSTLPAFLKLMEGWGTLNKKDDVFKMHNGGTVYLRTETDPDSIVGITNVRHIWGDEAGKYRLYFWENMQARADFCGCGIDLTTSPYALNWVFKEIIKPWREGKRPDVDFIHAPSWENPYHSLYNPEKLEAKKATMDPRRFAMLFGGEWGQMAGLVYDCWDDQQNLVEPFQLPVGTVYYGGVDWGFTDPFVMKVRAITPDGRHYGVSEFYKTGLTLSDMILIAKQKKQVYGIKSFFADPSQPGHIEEFNRNGLSCVGADNDIRRGVDLHYELIKTRKYKEFKGSCPYSADERETYHYPEPKDLGPDDDSKEQLPVGQGDHCMDVDRYITMMTYRRDGKLSPKEPGGVKMYKNRLDYLKRAHLKSGSEDWSKDG
jgi:PBSX family phage terminase large subunit